MRLPLLHLLLAALLLPASAAAASYDVKGVVAKDGLSSWHGRNLLLHTEAEPFGVLAIEARSLTVEIVERTSVDVDVPMGLGYSQKEGNLTTNRTEYGASRLELGPQGAQGDLVLEALRGADATVRSSGWSAFDPTQAAYTPPSYFETERPESHSLYGLHEVSIAPWSWDLSIEGDLTLVLWDWDFTVDGGSGLDRYWTGAEEEPMVSQGDALPLTRERWRKAFIHAEDAVVQVSWGSGEGCDLWAVLEMAYLGDGATLLLEDALDLEKRILEPALRLHGPAAVWFDPPKDGTFLVEEVGGEGEDGGARPGSAGGSVVAGWPLAVPWWLAALLGLAVLAVAGALLRRWLTEGYSVPGGPGGDALVQQALDDLREGRMEEVEAFLQDPDAAQRVGPAGHGFVLACLYALQGRRTDAQRELRRCLRLDPDYEAEALANPWTGPLLRHDTVGYA